MTDPAIRRAGARCFVLALSLSGLPTAAAGLDVEAPPEESSARYNELAMKQFHRGELEAAEASYRRSLSLIEGAHGISSRLLIAPLAGLASIDAARGLHARAIDQLRHATMVSRRADGLFTLGQLPLLEQLATSYEATGDRASVLGLRQYALAIAEQNFGPADARALPALRQLAALYESLGSHRLARNLFGQMRRIGETESATGNPVVVEALLGIGRSHRRQYIEAPSSLDLFQVRDPVSGDYFPLMSLEPYQGPRPSREGPRATAEAVALLRQADSPPPERLAEALIEMGDWNLALGKFKAALPYYAEAWAIHAHELVALPNPLSQPRLVLYRPPKASQRERGALSPEIVTRLAHFRLTIDASGTPREVVLEKSEVSARQAALLRQAIEDSRYSPRFEDGRAVATAGVAFEGRWDTLAGVEPDAANDLTVEGRQVSGSAPRT